MARDGQGLEVSNAGAEAIASLDFLRDEWLAFGNRLAEFIAAADKEASCALLPVMAANLMLSINSEEGRNAARKYLLRAKALGANANTREQAWLATTAAWIEGELVRSGSQLPAKVHDGVTCPTAGEPGALPRLSRCHA